MGSIIQNIKEIRLKKSISQQAIADELGVDVSAVSNIENGKRELKVSELAIIANILCVRVIDLFTYPKKFVESEGGDRENSEPLEAILQIKLRRDKQDQILKLVFGDNNLEILNK